MNSIISTAAYGVYFNIKLNLFNTVPTFSILDVPKIFILVIPNCIREPVRYKAGDFGNRARAI